jgi:hypothetical protein
MVRIIAVLGCVALFAPAAPVAARDFQVQAQQRDSYKGGRQAYPRDDRGADPRREQRRPERDDRRSGAMTDEERRGLHQDLDKANRELYRRRY